MDEYSIICITVKISFCLGLGLRSVSHLYFLFCSGFLLDLLSSFSFTSRLCLLFLCSSCPWSQSNNIWNPTCSTIMSVATLSPVSPEPPSPKFMFITDVEPSLHPANAPVCPDMAHQSLNGASSLGPKSNQSNLTGEESITDPVFSQRYGISHNDDDICLNLQCRSFSLSWTMRVQHWRCFVMVVFAVITRLLFYMEDQKVRWLDLTIATYFFTLMSCFKVLQRCADSIPAIKSGNEEHKEFSDDAWLLSPLLLTAKTATLNVLNTELQGKKQTSVQHKCS